MQQTCTQQKTYLLRRWGSPFCFTEFCFTKADEAIIPHVGLSLVPEPLHTCSCFSPILPRLFWGGNRSPTNKFSSLHARSFVPDIFISGENRLADRYSTLHARSFVSGSRQGEAQASKQSSKQSTIQAWPRRGAGALKAQAAHSRREPPGSTEKKLKRN